jgi:hypothetical protein
VQTTIGQLKDQGIRVGSRCLWDSTTDNYASSYFSNVSFIKSNCNVHMVTLVSTVGDVVLLSSCVCFVYRLDILFIIVVYNNYNQIFSKLLIFFESTVNFHGRC